ncbi:MAG: hemolysin family protein [Ignavibacteriaceae bacterium]|nr:hemolysin family protein [Ignavibacteriaceae bacterium]
MIGFLILIIFFLAALLTASGAAVISYNEDENGSSKTSKKIKALQQNIDHVYGLIEVAASFSLLMISFLLFFYIDAVVDASFVSFVTSIKISLILVSLLLLALCHWIFVILVPKAVGAKYAEKIAPNIVSILTVILKLFKIPIKILLFLTDAILLPLKTKGRFSHGHASEDEIRVIISEGVKSGAIDEAEHQIIENVFEFTDLKANEVMIPRTEMVAIELTDDDESMVKEIMQTGHSLVPIYQDSLDNIIGIIHIKDLMRSLVEKKNIVIKSLIRPVYFVPETKLISEIMKEMQKRSERISIVTDEYGGTEGVLTIEDILSEIVGDISSEGKNISDEYSKLPDGNFLVLGAISVEDFNEIFNQTLTYSDEYTTIAGFVAFQTGKILNIGEIYQHRDVTFELIKKVKQKMVQFKISILKGEEEEK